VGAHVAIHAEQFVANVAGVQLLLVQPLFVQLQLPRRLEAFVTQRTAKLFDCGMKVARMLIQVEFGRQALVTELAGKLERVFGIAAVGKTLPARRCRIYDVRHTVFHC
jgi:hypothetical protein